MLDPIKMAIKVQQSLAPKEENAAANERIYEVQLTPPAGKRLLKVELGSKSVSFPGLFDPETRITYPVRV